MITNENKKLAFAIFISTSLISCFGSEKSENISSTIELTEEKVTTLPAEDFDLKIIQDTDNKKRYIFTN